ncbi:MAG: transcriptional regulator, SarA/Rot family [Acidiferrobacteraceae bacterium]
MNTSFEAFKTTLDAVARELPELPRQEVVLTRLHFFLFRSLNEDMNQTLSEFGLNTTSMLGLVILYGNRDPINPSHLNYGMISSHTNTTRLIDEWVNKGWVQKNAGTQDRRKVYISLTESGRQLIERALPAQWARIKSIWGVLTPGEAALLEELLHRVWQRILEIDALDPR